MLAGLELAVKEHGTEPSQSKNFIRRDNNKNMHLDLFNIDPDLPPLQTLRLADPFGPAPPLFRPPLDPLEIPARAPKLPSGDPAQLEVHRLQVRVDATHQGLAEVVKTVPQVVRVRPFVVVVDVLHVREVAVQGCVIAHPQHILGGGWHGQFWAAASWGWGRGCLVVG